jgi:hypothetical protein
MLDEETVVPRGLATKSCEPIPRDLATRQQLDSSKPTRPKHLEVVKVLIARGTCVYLGDGFDAVRSKGQHPPQPCFLRVATTLKRK